MRGYSRHYNGTAVINRARNIEISLRGGTRHGVGYRVEPINCEDCKIVINPAGTRQTKCPDCRRKAKSAYWKSEEYRSLRAAERANIRLNPIKYKEYKARGAKNALKAITIKNELQNNHCKCGKLIQYDAKNCRKHVPTGRNHFRVALECSIKDCGSKHLAKGLCNKHYQRAMKAKPNKQKFA